MPVDRPDLGTNADAESFGEAGALLGRWRDYRFEDDHLVYYAQDADGTTAHRVIVTQAEDAFARQGRDFAREYFKYASAVNPVAAAVQAGVDVHDGEYLSALLGIAGLSKLGAVAGGIKIAGDAGGAARAADSEGSLLNKTLYRGDGRAPDTIFNESFQPRSKTDQGSSYRSAAAITGMRTV